MKKEDNHQTVNFECGCFVSFWADEEVVGLLRSAMACCSKHEERYQSLDNLSKTHYLSIRKRYVEPKRFSIDEQLNLVRTRYSDAIIRNDSRYGRVMVLSVPVNPDKWNTNQTRIAVSIPPGYPFSVPQYFWIDADLRLKSGAIPMRVGSSEDVCGEDMRMLQGNIQQWNPNTDTLYTAVKVMDLALQYRFVPRNYDRDAGWSW